MFKHILSLMAFPDLDQRFNDSLKDREYSLYNHASKACFLILWFNSIEPPFYFHLNEASRKKDQQLLPFLGPFACALYQILEKAEAYKRDCLELGYKKHQPQFNKLHPRGFMCSSFVVFRGASLMPGVVELWTQLEGQRMYKKEHFDKGVQRYDH